MKNYVMDGDVLTVTAPANVSSGDYIRVGAFAGVCQTTELSGASVAIAREGIFTLPKTTSQAWAVGDTAYWNPTTSKFTNVLAEGVYPAGVVAAAAASADTTGQVNIESLSTGIVRRAFGVHTTVAASDTVITGMVKVFAVVASMGDDPSDDPFMCSATIGDQAGAPAAGSVLIKTWKNTGGTDPTPLAATTFSKKVNWEALGV